MLGFQTALSSWQDNFSFKQLYVVFKFMLDTGNFKIDLSAASWYNTSVVKALTFVPEIKL